MIDSETIKRQTPRDHFLESVNDKIRVMTHDYKMADHLGRKNLIFARSAHLYDAMNEFYIEGVL